MLSLKILGEYMICLKIIILRKHVFQFRARRIADSFAL